MELAAWLFLSHMLAYASGQVLRNDPSIIACPEYSIVKNSTISSPLFPGYYPYFYCEYHIQAPEDRFIVIKFDEFDFPSRSISRRTINYDFIPPPCLHDFVEISDDEYFVNRFRYCGDELKDTEFVSRRTSVKLILQTWTKNEQTKNLKGFKATVTFPLRTANDGNDVRCSASSTPGYVRCTAPLKRRMTPESSLHLTVKKNGTKYCSKKVIVSAVPLKYPKESKNDVINLDHVCEKGSKNPIIYQLIDQTNLIYDVSSTDERRYEVLLKKFSTKRLRMCGGYIELDTDEEYKITYTADKERKHQTCLWMIHAKNFEDNTINVYVKTFSMRMTKFQNNRECQAHHLSMMYVGANMYQMFLHEVQRDPTKFQRICKPRTKRTFRRITQDIYGSLNLMMLLTHTEGFKTLEATITVKKV